MQAYKQEIGTRPLWVIASLFLFLQPISGADDPLAAGMPSTRTSQGGRKWALVAGINDYTDLPRLRFARQDAEAVGKTLRERCGFLNENVVLMIDSLYITSNDPTRSPTAGNLRSYISQLAKLAGQDDLLLIVFFGHGLKMDGTGFLVPADGMKSDQATLISHAWIKTTLEGSAARQKLLILDDCQSPAQPAAGGHLSELAPGLLSGADFLTLAAADSQQFSHEDEQLGHSVFAVALIDGLGGEADRGAAGNHDGVLTANELFEYSAMRVKQWGLERGQLQTPVLKGESRVRVELVNAALPSALPHAGVDYLTKESTDACALMGKFERFTNRFDKAAADRVYDRMLKRTWIVLRDPQNPNSTQRMDWAAAQAAASRLGARLPTLAELKTLITKERNQYHDVFTIVSLFPPSTRTKKCWTGDDSGILRPFQRYYVDFGHPDWGMTSMSEIHTVFMIENK
jgi:hypothetical protein